MVCKVCKVKLMPHERVRPGLLLCATHLVEKLERELGIKKEPKRV